MVVCPVDGNLWPAAADGDTLGVFAHHRKDASSDNNSGPATDVENAAADVKLNQYLDSPPGVAQIASKTPAPCGGGELDQHVNLPDPFPGTTAYINSLTLALGNGRIDITARAHADVFCGTINTTMPMWVVPTLNTFGQTIKLGTVNHEEPQTNIDADFLCEAAMDTLLSFITARCWAALSRC